MRRRSEAMREGSYTEIRPGMPVVGPGNNGEGRVGEVLYDEASDIFVGLVLLEGMLLKEHRLFVPGDHVVAVHDGRVTIDLPLASLEPYVSPGEKLAQAKERYTEKNPLDDVLI
jgi:hypothetical protein